MILVSKISEKNLNQIIKTIDSKKEKISIVKKKLISTPTPTQDLYVDHLILIFLDAMIGEM